MTKNQTVDVTRDRQCPFCLASLGSFRQGSNDHIFGRAFGGTATVRACKTCNQDLGSTVEGPLQQAYSLLNVFKIPLGAARAVNITLPNGSDGSINFVTGEVRTRNPVTVTEDGFHIIGSEQQARQVRQALLRKFSSTEVDRLIIRTESVSLGDQLMHADTQLDLRLWSRMVAKTALAAGCRVAPELFTGPAAEHLRDVCWGRDDPVGDPLAVAGFDRLAERMDQILREYPRSKAFEPFPDGGHGQMLFVSSVPGRLACVPKITGQEMPGIVVDWPGERWSPAGVLVTDTGGGAVVTRDLFQDLLRCLSH